MKYSKSIFDVSFAIKLAVSSAVSLVALLSACGGGQTGPSVSNMSATAPRFSQTMTISVSGQALDEGIELTVDGPCDSVSARPDATALSAQYTCLVNGVGQIIPRVRNTTNRRELASLRVEALQPRVTIAVTQGTRSGNFVVELDIDKAPLSVKNFLAYVNASPPSSYYANVIFHRVIKDVLVQAGGFTSSATGPRPTPVQSPIKSEAGNGLKNLRGSIAMARTDDADSATSQFYVNVADNPSRDFGSAENPAGFAVFGKVVQGLDVVDEISIVPTRDAGGGFTDFPVTDVRITSARQTQ